ELRVGAHGARGHKPVLQQPIALRVLANEVVLVDVVRSRRSFLGDASGVVVGDVVVHPRVVIGRYVVTNHDGAGEVVKQRVVDDDFVASTVPELDAPAGIAERDVVIDGGAGAHVAGAADVDAVDVVAGGWVGTVVMNVVA